MNIESLIEQGKHEALIYNRLIDEAKGDKHREYQVQWNDFVERTKGCLPSDFRPYLFGPDKFVNPPRTKEYLILRLPNLYPIRIRVYRKLRASEKISDRDNEYGGLREVYKIIYYQLRDETDSTFFDEASGVSLEHVPTLALAVYFSKKYGDLYREYEDFALERSKEPLSKEA